MMMPANYSAISENEMTYVNGGAIALSDILAPALTVENWQTFNKNMVTIIGNKFVGDYVKNTVGQLFGGNYVPGNLGRAWAGSIAEYFTNGAAAMGKLTDNAFLQGTNGVLNGALRVVGSAAAIYNLATAGVDNTVSSKDFIGITKNA